jgi:hypothetical protein
MLPLHLRNAFFSAAAASVASTLGVALYVTVEEPKSIWVGVGFGLSLALYGAALAFPAGLLLSLFRLRVSRASFTATTIVVAMALGGVLGWWFSATSYILFQPISVFLAITWAAAAYALLTLSRRSTNKSFKRTRAE